MDKPLEDYKSQLSPVDREHYEKYIEGQLPGVGWLKKKRDEASQKALKGLLGISQVICAHHDDKDFDLAKEWGIGTDLQNITNCVLESQVLSYCIQQIEEAQGKK